MPANALSSDQGMLRALECGGTAKGPGTWFVLTNNSVSATSGESEMLPATSKGSPFPRQGLSAKGVVVSYALRRRLYATLPACERALELTSSTLLAEVPGM